MVATDSPRFITLWGGTGQAVAFVTHDPVEPITMADRVLVFSARPAQRIERQFTCGDLTATGFLPKP